MRGYAGGAKAARRSDFSAEKYATLSYIYFLYPYGAMNGSVRPTLAGPCGDGNVIVDFKVWKADPCTTVSGCNEVCAIGAIVPRVPLAEMVTSSGCAKNT